MIMLPPDRRSLLLAEAAPTGFITTTQGFIHRFAATALHRKWAPIKSSPPSVALHHSYHHLHAQMGVI